MIRVTDKQYWMDNYLVDILNTSAYNLENHWDLMGIISGSGMTRTGKSMQAQQIGYYISWRRGKPFGIDNIVFSGKELITTALKLPPGSCIVYDESREDLESKKGMRKVSQNVMDFFSECGKLNHFFLVLLPDFFELNKGLACSRSEWLINQYRIKKEKKLADGSVVNEWLRGGFEFYNKDRKRQFYTEGKQKFFDYNLGIKYKNFFGEFREFWVIEPAIYEAKKDVFLNRDRSDRNESGGVRADRWFAQRNQLIAYCYNVLKLTQQQIADIIEKSGFAITREMVGEIVSKDSGVNGNGNTNILTLPPKKILPSRIEVR